MRLPSVRVGLVAVLTLAALLLPLTGGAGAAAAPRPASAAMATFRSDSAAFNGSFSAMGFTVSGNSRVQALRDIRVSVELPRSWANRYCAYARVGVNGVYRGQSVRVCDTNGDSTLVLYLPDLYAHTGDYIEAWISDPVTRFNQTHPTVILH